MSNLIKLKNLTPHAINIVGENGENIQTIESEWNLRLSTEIVDDWMIGDIPINKTKYLECLLPEEVEDTMYIVSIFIAQYAKEQWRKDFLIPWELVRDEKWIIIGCKFLSKI